MLPLLLVGLSLGYASFASQFTAEYRVLLVFQKNKFAEQSWRSGRNPADVEVGS